MICYICGEPIDEGQNRCPVCGAGQNERVPATSTAGKALRQLIDLYGCERILTDAAFTERCLPDMLPRDYALRQQVAFAMHAGIGNILIVHVRKQTPPQDDLISYLEKPLQDGGYSEETIRQIISYFYEAIGWPMPAAPEKAKPQATGSSGKKGPSQRQPAAPEAAPGVSTPDPAPQPLVNLNKPDPQPVPAPVPPAPPAPDPAPPTPPPAPTPAAPATAGPKPMGSVGRFFLRILYLFSAFYFYLCSSRVYDIASDAGFVQELMFDWFPDLTANAPSFATILVAAVLTYAFMHVMFALLSAAYHLRNVQEQFKRPEKVLSYWMNVSRTSFVSFVLSLITMPIVTTDALRLQVVGAVLSSNYHRQLISFLNADGVLATDIAKFIVLGAFSIPWLNSLRKRKNP